MPIQLGDGGAVAGGLKVESTKAARVVSVPRGNCYAVSGVSGTIGAALGANSSVFAMRLDPGAAVTAFLEQVRLSFTTIVAFTTPVTAGRRLSLFRGSGAAASGGTATPPVSKDSTSATSEFLAANGGDIRIASTAALTVTGITYETDPIATLTLVHVGAAGGFVTATWSFHATESAPLILSPGQLLAVRNPAAMDAAGTWQLGVDVEWTEAAAYAA